MALVGALLAITGATIFVQSCGKAAATAAPEAAASPTPTYELKGSTTQFASAASIMRQIWNFLDSGNVFGGTDFNGVLHGTPTNVRIKMFAAYLSLNEDCSSPVLVQDYGAGVEKSLSSGETLFSGTPPNGTYKCLIIKFSDQFKFNVAQADVAWWQTNHSGSACSSATTDFVFDAYRYDPADANRWVDLNGTAVTPHGTDAAPAEDPVYFFLSTSPTAAKANGVDVYAKRQTAQLTLATGVTGIVVPGTGTFFYDFSAQATNGTISGDPAKTSVCKLDGVFVWGYR